MRPLHLVPTLLLAISVPSVALALEPAAPRITLGAPSQRITPPELGREQSARRVAQAQEGLPESMPAPRAMRVMEGLPQVLHVSGAVARANPQPTGPANERLMARVEVAQEGFPEAPPHAMALPPLRPLVLTAPFAVVPQHDSPSLRPGPVTAAMTRVARATGFGAGAAVTLVLRPIVGEKAFKPVYGPKIERAADKISEEKHPVLRRVIHAFGEGAAAAPPATKRALEEL